MKLMPDETIEKYNLKKFEHDGWIYIKIVTGMYGLPQTGKIANELCTAKAFEIAWISPRQCYARLVDSCLATSKDYIDSRRLWSKV